MGLDLLSFGVCVLIPLELEVLVCLETIVDGARHPLLCESARLVPRPRAAYGRLCPLLAGAAINGREMLFRGSNLLILNMLHRTPFRLGGSSAASLSLNILRVGAAATADALLHDVLFRNEPRLVVEALALLLASVIPGCEAGAEHGAASLLHHLDGEVLGTEAVGKALEERLLCDDVDPLHVDARGARVDTVAHPVEAADVDGRTADILAILAFREQTLRERDLVDRLQELDQDAWRCLVDDLGGAILNDVAELANLGGREDRHLGGARGLELPTPPTPSNFSVPAQRREKGWLRLTPPAHNPLLTPILLSLLGGSTCCRPALVRLRSTRSLSRVETAVASALLLRSLVSLLLCLRRVHLRR